MAVTSTHFAKCRRTLLEWNSYEPYSSSKRERKFYVLHKTWNQVFSRRSREITAAKCTRKCNARAKLLFCLSRPFFSWFGLPSTCVRRVKTVIENASSQNAPQWRFLKTPFCSTRVDGWSMKTRVLLKTITSRCWLPVSAHAPITDGTVFSP